MPRFQPDYGNVAAGIPLLNDGFYIFSIGEHKPFARMTQKGDQSFGVSYALTTEANGQTVRLPYRLNVSSKDAAGFNKQFLMAALGFNKSSNEEERAFNAQFGNEGYMDVEWDGDVGTVNEVGPVYKAVEGCRIAAHVKTTPNKETGDPQNQFNWVVAAK